MENGYIYNIRCIAKEIRKLCQVSDDSRWIEVS